MRVKFSKEKEKNIKPVIFSTSKMTGLTSLSFISIKSLNQSKQTKMIDSP